MWTTMKAMVAKMDDPERRTILAAAAHEFYATRGSSEFAASGLPDSHVAARRHARIDDTSAGMSGNAGGFRYPRFQCC